MTNELNPNTDPNRPMAYQIRLKGHLDREWAGWFEGLTVTLEEDGNTLLTGEAIDQAALHGLFKKMRDLGMPLVSVNRVEPDPIGVSSVGETHRDLSKKEQKMNANRINTTIVGVLFIIGTVSGTVAASIGRPVLGASDYLIKISASESRIMIGTLLAFIMGVCCAGIGLALYPILKKYNEGLAIGSAGFRIIEGVLEIVGAISPIALLALSREFVKAGTPDAAYFQVTGALIKAGGDWVNNVAVLLSWCIGALIYYSVFYQYKLVPRWLSGWGLVGITLTIVTSLLVMFRIIAPFGTIQVTANLPIALQEMVFAVWLIAKGVRPSAIAAGDAKIYAD
jgi:hypothetical protein